MLNHLFITLAFWARPKKDVVDSHLKVYGIESLRVADASIFPKLVCGNINAATIMVGEKASDLILQDQVHV